MRTKRTFKVKWKAFFILFKGLSVAKNCLRPESAPFSKCEQIHRKLWNWKILWWKTSFFVKNLSVNCKSLKSVYFSRGNCFHISVTNADVFTSLVNLQWHNDCLLFSKLWGRATNNKVCINNAFGSNTFPDGLNMTV